MSEWTDQEAEIAKLVTASITNEPSRWRATNGAGVLQRDDGIAVAAVQGGAGVTCSVNGVISSVTVSGECGNELSALVRTASKERFAKGVDAILTALRGK